MFTRARKMFYRARGYCAGTLNGEPFRLDPYHSKFWRRASRGDWEPETFAMLDRHLSADRDYVDIGAWIGPTVLYAARRARHVWCFEPDPVAFRHLVWNLELNGIRNVSAFCVALSDGFGVANMASFGGEAGDSMTSLLNGGDNGTPALTIGWDQFATSVDLGAVSLVKMDIEGGEFAVLPAMQSWLQAHRPPLYLSTHAPFLPDADRKPALETLANALSCYDQCEGPGGITGPRAALSSDAALTRFPGFLFRP